MLWQDGLLQLFQYLQENRAFCLCALRSMGRDHLKRFFQTDIRAIIQSTIRLIAAELGYEAGEQELTMLTQFYVGALVSIVEDWLLGEIQGTPEELICSASGHVCVFWEKEATQKQGLHITARVNTSQGIRCRAVADVLPRFAQPAEPTLEDAYLYLISREAVQ